MAILDTAMQNTVNEIIKGSKDLEVYGLPAFVGTSEIIKCLTDIKNFHNKNKGSDITIVLSVK